MSEVLNFLSIYLDKLLNSQIFYLLLGFYISTFLNRKSFVNEYHKILILKRVNAYEKLENILRIFTARSKFEDKTFHSIFENFIVYHKFYEELNENLKSSGFWLKKEILGETMRLSFYLNYHVEPLKSDKELVCFGIKHHESITSILVDLTILLYNDLQTLHKTKDFFKDRMFKQTRIDYFF